MATVAGRAPWGLWIAVSGVVAFFALGSWFTIGEGCDNAELPSSSFEQVCRAENPNWHKPRFYGRGFEEHRVPGRLVGPPTLGERLRGNAVLFVPTVLLLIGLLLGALIGRRWFYGATVLAVGVVIAPWVMLAAL